MFPATLAIIKILGYFKLDSLEPKGNLLADISAKNTSLSRDQQLNLCQGPGIFPLMITQDNLAREGHRLTSEKEKKKKKEKFGDSTISKKEKILVQIK